jgi:hypothetical protein
MNRGREEEREDKKWERERRKESKIPRDKVTH